ncbi:MAG: helix-turn-helix domain-containing protein [Planctomycetota bacterium]|nr:MAG: helix-turn-helix domain-containing protein [Planctomycetota bacterium]REJ88751.1 MAG: helix-turn-helix domain-containing protein [Planctomycetota bacterium]REK26592.1 MAG: helix-turn-helix domain-containing protein [Planctomycetota bacterium]REK46093.1 MAG: helix-turn-helix domain-containing protein [Planctomycetota bacterium]
MVESEGKTEHQENPDNVEFVGLVERLAGLGVTQQDVASMLGITPSHLSRVKRGERRASPRHFGRLRGKVRDLTKRRSAQPVSAPRLIGSSPFSVNHAVLRSLSPNDAVFAFRDLLWAQAMAKGVSTTRVRISARVNAPDGGIDASIQSDHDNPFQDDKLLTAGTQYQIKTGEFKPWQPSTVRKELFAGKEEKFENLDSEIQATLRDGKRYVVVCFGTDPLPYENRKAVDGFRAAFGNCGFPDVPVEVWGQTELIGLYNAYPGLCLRLRGQDEQIFRLHDSWSADEDMGYPLHYGPEQHRLIEEIRNDLHSGAYPHVRLIGEPGIGKTRLALEVTRTKELVPLTMYVRDGRSLLQSKLLNELLQKDDHRVVLLVIDECSRKDLADIWNVLKPRSHRIRIITIDHDPHDGVDEKTRVVKVEPSGSDQIESILADHGIGEDDARRWAMYCDGCPRVAHILGVNLLQNPSDPLAPPTISDVWDRFIVGRDPSDSEDVRLRRIVLRYVSLFDRFGFEQPVQNEAGFIQGLAEKCDSRITAPKFREIIKGLKGRRIVQGQTTLYVTPRALHVHLYREFWELYGGDFDIAQRLRDTPQSLWRWFVDMLKYAHDCSAAERAIEKLLGPEGILQDGEFPDVEEYGKLMSALAEACPASTLHCLQRTIGCMSVDDRRRIATSRQWLVWALEKIAIWQEHFFGAAELLLGLAEAENATNSNNATGTFVGLFSLIPGWGPTQAGPDTRIRALEEALESPSLSRARLGLKACVNALSTTSSSRIVGLEHQGIRPTIPFWTPDNYGELWDAYRGVWQLLVDRLDVWTGGGREELISAIIEASWSALHVKDLEQTVVETLDAVALVEETNVKEVVELIHRQLRNAKSGLSDETRESLRVIVGKLEGNDFPTKLRRYIKYVTWEDYHDDNYDETRLVDRKLDELADAVHENPDLLTPEVRWLVCEDSSPAFSFAYRLGRKDVGRSLLSLILEQYATLRDMSATSFLSGYLAAVFDRDVGEWESLMLDLADDPAVAERFSDLVVASGMSDAIARKVIDHCRAGAQGIHRLERWWLARQLQLLSEEIIKELIEIQLGEGTGVLWNNAVQMFHTYYRQDDDRKPLPDTLTFRLLTAKAMAEGRAAHNAGYYWSRIAASFVDQHPDRKWDLLREILVVAADGSFLLADLDTNQEQVLTALFREDPVAAWKCVDSAYRELGGSRNFAMHSWLSRGGHRAIGDDTPGPIQYVSSKTLFDWVDEDLEERGYWLTRVLPKTLDQNGPGKLTRDFIARYGRDERIRNGVNSNFYSRGWCGDASTHYRKLRDDARSWLHDEKNSTVIRWVDAYIDSLSHDIERAEVDEERDF